jgi:hypothetical protein
MNQPSPANFSLDDTILFGGAGLAVVVSALVLVKWSFVPIMDPLFGFDFDLQLAVTAGLGVFVGVVFGESLRVKLVAMLILAAAYPGYTYMLAWYLDGKSRVRNFEIVFVGMAALAIVGIGWLLLRGLAHRLAGTKPKDF